MNRLKIVLLNLILGAGIVVSASTAFSDNQNFSAVSDQDASTTTLRSTDDELSITCATADDGSQAVSRGGCGANCGACPFACIPQK